MKYKISTKIITQLADIHTPVAIYNKLRDHYPGALLFESADYHDRSDNKSYLCLHPIARFMAKEEYFEYNFPGQPTVKKQFRDKRKVFNAFIEFVSNFEPSESQNKYTTQGLWGYSSFESVQYMEDINLSTLRKEEKDNPDLLYQFFSYIIIFDHFTKELHLVAHNMNNESIDDSELEKILTIIQSNQFAHFNFQTQGEECSNITDKQFKNMVSQGIEHCQLGDTFQVVLSRQFQQSFTGDDFTLYRCLRSVSPSPYLFYMDFGDFTIFGSSPESQLQIHDRIATINPIAGTVVRGDDSEEDLKKAEELKSNAKEVSEHVMLVDLARNDLSINCDDVKVENYAEIQYFSQVIHMVSKVSGRLSKDKNGVRVFGDTFPAGTLSGAPKYRAMQIIAEYEKTSRNFYGGAVGFFGFDGSINHAIIIRSVLSKNNILTYQAGAGVVVDSTPEGELNEVHNKLKAIRLSIQKANDL